MKKEISRAVWISLYCVFVLAGCNKVTSEVVIRGQFAGGFPEALNYTFPVNETAFDGFYERVLLDSAGRFEIRVDISKPVFIHFGYHGSPALIVEPGKSYEVSFYLNEHATLHIESIPAEPQRVYASFVHQHPMSCLYSYGEEISNYQLIRHKLLSDMQAELNTLDEKLEKGYISKEVWRLLQHDRKIYYYTALSVLASRNHIDFRRRAEAMPGDIFEIWEEAVHGISLESNELLSSFYAYDFLEMYIWYSIYSSHDFDEFWALRAEHRAGGTIHGHNTALAREYLSCRNLEFYLAGGFFQQQWKRDFGQDLPSLFEQFKRDFPDSKYMPFVERTVESMMQKL